MDQQALQIRIASRVLLLNNKNELLLVAKKEHMEWFTPGGRVEPGESIEQAAIRETYEETGLSVEILKLVYIRESFDHPSNKKPYHHIMFYFLARTEEELPEKWEDHDGYVELNKFFSQTELEQVEKVWPGNLRNTFWDDLKADFPNHPTLEIFHNKPYTK